MAWAEIAGQRVGGGMVCGSAWIWMVRRAALTNLRIDQPVWRSIQRLTAPQGGEDDAQVGLDRVSGAVVDGPGLQGNPRPNSGGAGRLKAAQYE